MKRIITSVVILILMSAASVFSVVTVDRFTDKMLQQIDNVEDAFEKNDTETSTQEAEKLENLWKRFREYAILVNDLGHALDITSSIAEISSFAREGNEELYAACDRAAAQIEIFKDMQTPTFWKIL